jgi:hypothetical protein
MVEVCSFVCLRCSGKKYECAGDLLAPYKEDERHVGSDGREQTSECR